MGFVNDNPKRVPLPLPETNVLMVENDSKIHSLERGDPTSTTTDDDDGSTELRVNKLSAVLYAIVSLLFSVQLLAILHNHSHLGGLTIFDTIFLLITKADSVNAHKWLFSDQQPIARSELTPLLLIIASSVFQALVFVNFTHALEAITCSDSSSRFSELFLATVLLNLVLKLFLLLCFPRSLQIPTISALRRHILHLGPSVVTLSLAAANYYFSQENGELVTLLDRYLGAGMCVLLSFIVLPIFFQNVPFLLLCDAPKGEREAQFKAEIEKRFPAVQCSHLHIFRKWPGHEFDVLLHIKVDESGQEQLQTLLCDLQMFVKRLGARRVTIQPWLAVPGEQPAEKGDGSQFSVCVSEECRRADKLCCSAESEDDNDNYEDEDGDAVNVSLKIEK